MDILSGKGVNTLGPMGPTKLTDRWDQEISKNPKFLDDFAPKPKVVVVEEPVAPPAPVPKKPSESPGNTLNRKSVVREEDATKPTPKKQSDSPTMNRKSIKGPAEAKLEDVHTIAVTNPTDSAKKSSESPTMGRKPMVPSSAVLESPKEEPVKAATVDPQGTMKRIISLRVLTLSSGSVSRRTASTLYQTWLCHWRSITQQQRLIGSFVLEIGVAILAGGMMGLSIMGFNGEMFRGIYVAPYTMISPAPIAWLIPLVGLLTSLAVGLAVGDLWDTPPLR